MVHFTLKKFASTFRLKFLYWQTLSIGNEMTVFQRESNDWSIVKISLEKFILNIPIELEVEDNKETATSEIM